MKKLVALVLGMGTLLLAGCASPQDANTQWEYKAALTPIGPEGTRPVRIERREQFLNQMGKEGWVLVGADGDLFYLKRPKK